jgi:hypothetical protein
METIYLLTETTQGSTEVKRASRDKGKILAAYTGKLVSFVYDHSPEIHWGRVLTMSLTELEQKLDDELDSASDNHHVYPGWQEIELED